MIIFIYQTTEAKAVLRPVSVRKKRCNSTEIGSNKPEIGIGSSRHKSKPRFTLMKWIPTLAVVSEHGPVYGVHDLLFNTSFLDSNNIQANDA